jgi:RNA-binding protein
MALNGKQRRYLRGLGNALQPVVQVGKEGLSDSVAQAIERALEDHELIKIRVLESCEADTRTAAADLAGRTRAELIQTLGRTALLFRRRAKEPLINFPAEAAPEAD